MVASPISANQSDRIGLAPISLTSLIWLDQVSQLAAKAAERASGKRNGITTLIPAAYPPEFPHSLSKLLTRARRLPSSGSPGLPIRARRVPG